MDLGAYANITDLQSIADKNNIDVPRLRGYRLMANEKPMTLDEFMGDKDAEFAEELCRSEPFWNPKSLCQSYDCYTNWLVEYYCPNNKVRWDRIHGWKRRTLKTYIHNETQKYKKQLEVWNKYAGQEGILYIHSRIGGWNWQTYYREVIYQPWFLEKVDDAFDSTYCDIYAKITI